MNPTQSRLPERILALLAGALILKIVISVFLNYRNYFPPSFSSEFLHGREAHFSGPYRWAFFTHILSGPVSLILGLVLIAERGRARFPGWHRVLGRVQVACVLLLVTPSGLWMARYAAAGPVGAVGLAGLAMATGISAALGAREAMRRRWAGHRRWMWRGYLLLCSAVVLRLLGGLATVAEMTQAWVDPLAIWVSWLGPLAVFEWGERAKRAGGWAGLSTNPR